MQLQLTVDAPFSLLLTGRVLRRTAVNAVDYVTDEGALLRFVDFDGACILTTTTQTDPRRLRIESSEPVPRRALRSYLDRRLGLGRDMSMFLARAAEIAWLHPVFPMLAGLRPPRYPSLWEACVNAVLFQQISLAAAAAIMRRFVLLVTSAPVQDDAFQLRPFPTPRQVLDRSDEALRSTGLSTAKITAIRSLADAVAGKKLDESALSPLSSPDLALFLQEYPGVGRWTAAVILLRGFGRLDVFPENDSGAARSLHLLDPALTALDVARARQRLGEFEGMLYYCLLLARPEYDARRKG